jgi:K+-sensing histidine kinase KdpD
VTKIVVGKTGEQTSMVASANSLVDRLLRDSGNMDVVVVRGVDEPHPESAQLAFQRHRPQVHP